jgi:hypothetical protein
MLSAFNTVPRRAIAGCTRVKAGFNAISESDLRSNLTSLLAMVSQVACPCNRVTMLPRMGRLEFTKAGLRPAANDASGKPSFLQSVPLDRVQTRSLGNLAESLPQGQRAATMARTRGQLCIPRQR